MVIFLLITVFLWLQWSTHYVYPNLTNLPNSELVVDYCNDVPSHSQHFKLNYPMSDTFPASRITEVYSASYLGMSQNYILNNDCWYNIGQFI